MKFPCLISRFWFLVSGPSSSVFRSYFCLLLVAFCSLPFNLFSAPASVFAVTTQEVEEALTCQCGCGLTVHSCNHLQCGFAIPAKKKIAELVAQGVGKDEISASFVAQYGEKVLSAPTTSGFNLAAWITPFVAVILGGAFIGFLSLRWSRKRGVVDNQPASPPASDPYRERMKKELDSFEG